MTFNTFLLPLHSFVQNKVYNILYSTLCKITKQANISKITYYNEIEDIWDTNLNHILHNIPK